MGILRGLAAVATYVAARALHQGGVTFVATVAWVIPAALATALGLLTWTEPCVSTSGWFGTTCTSAEVYGDGPRLIIGIVILGAVVALLVGTTFAVASLPAALRLGERIRRGENMPVAHLGWHGINKNTVVAGNAAAQPNNR
jgi:hypothetical protein